MHKLNEGRFVGHRWIFLTAMEETEEEENIAVL